MRPRRGGRKDHPGIAAHPLGATADEERGVDVVAAAMRPGDLVAAYAPANTKCCCQIRAEKCREIAASIEKALAEIGGGPRLGWLLSQNGASPGALMPTPARRRAAATTRLRLVQFVCDAQMMALYQKAAGGQGNANVLILARPGGQEVLANYIHSESRRADKPFLKLNCAAVAELCSTASSSGTSRGFTEPTSRARGSSKPLTAEPCSSTKWARCRCPCRPNCCAQRDRAKLRAWAARLS